MNRPRTEGRRCCPPPRWFTLLLLCLPGLLGGWLVGRVNAGQPPAWQLLPQAQVDSQGIFLSQLLAATTESSPPCIQLAPAPAFGKALALTRAQIGATLQKSAPDFVVSNWSGADKILITRRARSLEEAELKSLLTVTLQQASVRDRGELELRLGRPWATVSVPDEPLELRVFDLPVAGVTPNFIARFELRAGAELVGSWQLPVQARVLRVVWVARAALQRGQGVREADLAREQRDLLTLREALVALPRDAELFEVGENVPAGMPLSSRSVRLRPVIRRGKIVEALLTDGGLVISLKVEALEDGVPGQTVRFRNLQSKREFRGKVKNEETILVSL